MNVIIKSSNGENIAYKFIFYRKEKSRVMYGIFKIYIDHKKWRVLWMISFIYFFFSFELLCGYIKKNVENSWFFDSARFSLQLIHSLSKCSLPSKDSFFLMIYLHLSFIFVTQIIIYLIWVDLQCEFDHSRVNSFSFHFAIIIVYHN